MKCEACGCEPREGTCGSYDTSPDENGDVHHQYLCRECARTLHWKIAELAGLGFYVHSERKHFEVEFEDTDERYGRCAGKWTKENVHRYPLFDKIRRENGYPTRVEVASKNRPAPMGEDRSEGARLMAFFFGREANVRADGTLAVSPSGREWF